MLAGCALLLTLAGAARAERVLVLAGGEPPCVRAAELAAALGRHGQLATVVRAVPEQSDAALVGVRASAAGLEVRLLRPSGLSERVIATPPCEVAVEVVAAWVASVLDGTLVVAAPSVAPAPTPEPSPAPAPATAPAAAAPAPAVDMRAAVLAEMAWAGLDLEPSGYSLALEGRAGNWRLALGRDGCTRRRAVGGVPQLREAAVTRLVAAVASMLGDPAGCLRGEASPERRRRLGRAMAATLDGSQLPVQPLFSLSLGALSLAGAAADSAPGDDQEALLGIGGGLMLVGGAVGWGLDDKTYAEPVLDTLMWTGAGLSTIAIAAEPEEASAFLAQGVIELFEGMLNPPVPRARLRRHLRRMKGSATPSSADIAAAERDLRWAPSQPYRIATALNFFGAAVAAATRQPDRELSRDELRRFQSRAATSASLLICLGVIMVLDTSRWSDYQGRVRDSSVRVEVGVMAGGAALSARGRF
ncbi:MAG: hypothetical protein IT370_22655 [Deltaproteobacteria bacterium]|nr:hypothetical protein [Deltaproteobacteria bacterium]